MRKRGNSYQPSPWRIVRDTGGNTREQKFIKFYEGDFL